VTPVRNRPITPTDFEEMVADDFRRRGYDIEVRGGTNDWGIDIIARRGAESLAIQAKMYAGARPVNRRQVFELFGVANYFGHSRAVIATDGRLASDAEDAARKLGIEIWRPLGTSQVTDVPDSTGPQQADGDQLPPFDELWELRVMPLAGQTLTRVDGSSNRILAVDWAGVTRITSGGQRQRIPIEPFQWAIERVRELGHVTRDEINDHHEGRASSGIALILAQIPELEVVGRPLTIRATTRQSA
jgi:hypothetical protein